MNVRERFFNDTPSNLRSHNLCPRARVGTFSIFFSFFTLPFSLIQAAALLANLSEVEEHRAPLVQELHVVPALVALARQKARDARFDAARALSHLACCEDNHVLLYDQVSRLLSYFRTISYFVMVLHHSQLLCFESLNPFSYSTFFFVLSFDDNTANRAPFEFCST